MSFIGSWQIDDLLTFYVNTHDPATGGVIDADAVPGYRIYEDEAYMTLTGSMALLDDANTVGFYSEQITLSAANGFEVGKSYVIRITAVVAGVTGVTLREFQVEAAGADSAGIADAVWDELRSGHVAIGSFGQAEQTVRSSTAAAGAAGSITLDAGASGSDDFYNGCIVVIVSGTGSGQARRIDDYTGGTKIATVVPNWAVNPANDSVFIIIGQ